MEESVRLWRPAGQPLLMIHGRVSSYAADPDGEYAIGLIGERGLQVTRNRRRYALYPGDIGVWDPGQAHRGAPLDGAEPWRCRLLVIEQPALTAVAGDPDSVAVDLEFPDPILRHPALSAEFLRLHRAMERPTWTLERDTLLVEWMARLVAHAPTARPIATRRTAGRDPALARACEFLEENLTANVTLDELAAAAGTSKYRLVRLFRSGLGMPPHRFALAQRVRLARRMLERGSTVTEVALATGFFDQSHLHRHFRRSLGIAPGRYAQLFRRTRQNVQDNFLDAD